MREDVCQWKTQPVLEESGVIVGCNQNQEWLLTWWWMHYCMHNEYPVIFFDFGGMSSAAKNWCAKRGRLVTLKMPEERFVVPQEKISTEVSSVWNLHENLDTYKARLEWFKKPFACLQSFFRTAVWIDLDCQVRKSIAPIFKASENDLGIAIAEEPSAVLKNHEESGLIKKGEMEYNTGVIAFQHGSPVIQDWAKICIESNDILRGDQEAMSRMALLKGIKVPALPPTCNHRWHLYMDPVPVSEQRWNLNIDPNTVIVHYLGNGKDLIQIQMLFLRNELNIDFSLT